MAVMQSHNIASELHVKDWKVKVLQTLIENAGENDIISINEKTYNRAIRALSSIEDMAKYEQRETIQKTIEILKKARELGEKINHADIK